MEKNIKELEQIYEQSRGLEALRSLAESGIPKYQEILKKALCSGKISRTVWTDFRYISDIDFVIDYVNNPKFNYHTDDAFRYLHWLGGKNGKIGELNANATRKFCEHILTETFGWNPFLCILKPYYNSLPNSSKDNLYNKHLEGLDHICLSFYISIHRKHGMIETFDHSVKYSCEKYLTLINAANDSIRIDRFNIEVEKFRQKLFSLFMQSLYGNRIVVSNTILRRNYDIMCCELRRVLKETSITRQELLILFIKWLNIKVSSIKMANKSIYFEYDVNTSYLLPKLQKIVTNAGLKQIEIPKVYISTETPPLIQEHPEIEDPENGWRYIDGGADTEMLLGCYIPSKKHIILYERGIHVVARLFKKDISKLREIVFIHELGHYIQHMMPLYTTTKWITLRYNKSYAPKDLLEAWAQLMDEWVVRGDSDQEYENIFDQLVLCQSSPYRAFKNYKHTNFPQLSVDDYYKRLLSSVDDLRNIQCKATIADWNNIL